MIFHIGMRLVSRWSVKPIVSASTELFTRAVFHLEAKLHFSITHFSVKSLHGMLPLVTVSRAVMRSKISFSGNGFSRKNEKDLRMTQTWLEAWFLEIPIATSFETVPWGLHVFGMCWMCPSCLSPTNKAREDYIKIHHKFEQFSLLNVNVGFYSEAHSFF